LFFPKHTVEASIDGILNFLPSSSLTKKKNKETNYGCVRLKHSAVRNAKLERTNRAWLTTTGELMLTYFVVTSTVSMPVHY
jgi:hypothetical protein